MGFFQKNFQLTGHEVRQLTVKRPKLITSDLEKVKVRKFVLKEEMGFSEQEIKTMILKKPAILAKCEQMQFF